MEFSFNVNHLLGDTISVVDRDLRPFCKHSHGNEKLQANLERVIDEMGKASSKAQGLNNVITTSCKLRYSDNRVYVVKDASANRGLGVVVGILKIGKKNLFVLDRHGDQTEMQPTCVLDFYVHESCQRKGYGKKLFGHMLQTEGIRPQHLAIDRPSHKFTSFLMKHYNLRATISQVNNFVVFEGFFNNQPESSYCRRRSGVQPSPPQPHRNATTAGVWGSRGSPSASRREREALRDVRPPSRGSLSSGGSNDGSLGVEMMGLEISSRGLGAQANSYSRYNTRSSTLPSRVTDGGRRGSLNKSPSAGNAGHATTGSPLVGEHRRNSWDNNQGNSANNAPRTTRENTPPPFGSIGAFSAYNSHLQAQTRNGHLKVSPNSTTSVVHAPSQNNQQSNAARTTMNAQQELPSLQGTSNPSSFNPSGNYVISYESPGTQNKTMHSSWNVMGIPPSRQQRGSPGQQNPYQQSTAQQSTAQQSPGQQNGSQQSPGYRNQHWSSHPIF